MTADLENTKIKLQAHWSKRQYGAADAVISTHLSQVIVDYATSRGLPRHDAKDVGGTVMEKYFKRVKDHGHKSISRIWPFLWKILSNCIADRHRALTVAKRRETTAKGDHDEPPHAFFDGLHSELAASFPKNGPGAILEALFEDIDIPLSEAPRLVRCTLVRLPKHHATILRGILKKGPKEAFLAARRLGTKDGTYRQRKKRAYSAFKKLCPKIAEDLNIGWRGIYSAENDYIPGTDD